MVGRSYCSAPSKRGMRRRLQARGVRVKQHTFSLVSNGRLGLTLHQLIRSHHLAIPDDGAAERLGRPAAVLLVAADAFRGRRGIAPGLRGGATGLSTAGSRARPP